MVSIEELQQKVDDIKKWLSELKDDISISEKDKKKKAESFKSETKAIEKDIKSEIRSLEGKTDAESLRKKEEAEVLLNSCDSIMNLYESILKSQKSKSKEQARETEQEDSKENEGKKKLLRTVWLLWIGTWTLALIFNRKKLFGKDKEKKEDWDKDHSTDGSESKKDTKKDDNEKKLSLWRKGLLALWIWTTGYIWYKHRDKVKQAWWKVREKIKWWFEKEKPLTFDEALKSVTSEVRNWKIKENPFRQHFEWGIEYDEWSWVILSYWEETKIDIKNKTIEWLSNITFPDYEQLIHAANIINFARRNFAGKCQSDTPFDIQSSEAWWDLTVHLANWENPEWIGASDSNLWRNVLWTWWCAVWTVLWAYIWWIKWAVWLWATLWLWWVAAWDYLDNNSSMWNTVHDAASGTNLKRFKNCLNDQKDSKWNSLWPKRSDVRPDIVSPISEEVREIFDEIILTGWEWDWWRNLKCEQNRENPEIFTISSYGQKINITLKWCVQMWSEHIDYSKITSIKIWKYRTIDWWDWLEINFPHNKNWLIEAIRVANLTNLLRWNNSFAWNWGEKYPFAYWKYWTYYNLLNKNLNWNASFNLDMDTFGWLGKAVLSHNMLETKFPTLLKDLEKQVNKTNQDMLYKQAKWNKDLEWYGSHYLRYLHQMRNEFDSQSYWVNWQIKS